MEDQQALLLAYDDEASPLRTASLLEKAVEYVNTFHNSLGAETKKWREMLKSVREELARQANKRSKKASQIKKRI